MTESLPRLLVLGGGAFVGRAVVDAAMGCGWRVTTLSWERQGRHGVEHLVADRNDRGATSVLAGRTWDLVVDTWRGHPGAIRASARALSGRVGTYAYVSSLVVYRSPARSPLTEDCPLISLREDRAPLTYAHRKAAGEREVLDALGDRALIARAGLVLGPYEYAGRLPWWLRHVRSQHRMLAPGRPDRPVQFVDARDLAAWLLRCAGRSVGGVFNVAAPPGHATMGDVLEQCRQVTGSVGESRWVSDEVLLGLGVEPWDDIPLWIPWRPREGGVYDVDVTRAHATGSGFRDARLTVADTWTWLEALGGEARQVVDDRPWLSRSRERAILDATGHGGGIGSADSV